MWSFANSIDFFGVIAKIKCVAANYTSSPKKEDVYYLLNTFVALVREEANIGNCKEPTSEMLSSARERYWVNGVSVVVEDRGCMYGKISTSFLKMWLKILVSIIIT